jgi:hypothetical protein
MSGRPRSARRRLADQKRGSLRAPAAVRSATTRQSSDTTPRRTWRTRLTKAVDVVSVRSCGTRAGGGACLAEIGVLGAPIWISGRCDPLQADRPRPAEPDCARSSSVIGRVGLQLRTDGFSDTETPVEGEPPVGRREWSVDLGSASAEAQVCSGGVGDRDVEDAANELGRDGLHELDRRGNRWISPTGVLAISRARRICCRRDRGWRSCVASSAWLLKPSRGCHLFKPR